MDRSFGLFSFQIMIIQKFISQYYLSSTQRLNRGALKTRQSILFILLAVWFNIIELRL